MADGTVKIDTELDDSGFTQGLNKLKNVGSVTFDLLTKSIIATSVAMGSVIGTGVKFNSEIETLQTSFEVMTGSADKAREITKNLKDLASATPFELKDLAKTTNLLMQYGLTADDAQARLKVLGDISQGNADKLNRVATAYGQMSSSGKVMLEDVKQMIEAGFNPLQQISMQTGESMSSLYNRISKGTLTVDEVTTAMQKATEQGGMYFGSMQKQSETLAGQISTLKDNFGSLSGVLSTGITDSIRTKALPALNELLTGLESAFVTGGFTAFAQKLGEGLANIAVSISQQAPAFLQAGILIVQNLIQGILNNKDQILTALIDLTNVMVSGISTILPMLIDLGLQILTGLLSGFAKDPSKIVNSIIDLINKISASITQNLPIILDAGIKILMALVDGIGKNTANLIPIVIEVIKKIADVIIQNLPIIIKTGLDILIALITGIVDSLPKLIAEIPKIINAIVTVLTEPNTLKQIIYAALIIIVELAKGLIQAIPQLISAVPVLIQALVTAFFNLLGTILEIGKDIVKWIWDGIVGVAGWIAGKFASWGGDVIKWIGQGLATIWKVGEDIVTGIWMGIAGAAQWLWNKVSTWASGILTSIKNTMGIASPSKITMQFGKYLAQGLGIGFDKEIDNVYSEMESAISLQNQKIGWNLQTGGVYNRVMNTTPVIVNGSYTSNLALDGEIVATAINKIDYRRELQYGY